MPKHGRHKSAPCCCPCSNHLQGLETYKGSVDCAMSILRSHGLKGLYRGMTSTILRDIQVGRAPLLTCGRTQSARAA